MGAAKKKEAVKRPCPSCGYDLPDDMDYGGDGAHIDFECIQNLQEQIHHLEEAVRTLARKAHAFDQTGPFNDHRFEELEEIARDVLARVGSNS